MVCCGSFVGCVGGSCSRRFPRGLASVATVNMGYDIPAKGTFAGNGVPILMVMATSTGDSITSTE